MTTQYQPAIERFSAREQVQVNHCTVYATHVRSVFHEFFATEEEAIAHCAKPGSGFIDWDEYEWIQDTYTAYKPGELFLVDSSVYISNDRTLDPISIAGAYKMPFVTWLTLPFSMVQPSLSGS